MATLRIGLPVYNVVHPYTVTSLWSLSKTDSVLEILTGTYIDQARNMIIEHLKEPYLLFVDADMVFNQDHVAALVGAMEADEKLGAVAGHYLMRNTKGEPGSTYHPPVCNWMKDGAWLRDDERESWAEKCGRDVVEVGVFGMGLTLCRGTALNDMEFPYMESGYNRDNEYMGEDACFCFKMRDAGWKTAVHFGVRVGHVGQEVFWPRDYTEERVHAVQ